MDDLNDIDDFELQVRLIDREQTAVAQLVRQHAGKVKGFLKGRYPDIPPEDRTYILQLTVRKAVRHAGQYDENRSFAAWLITIADNTRAYPKT